MQASKHPFTDSGRPPTGRFVSPLREQAWSNIGRRVELDDLPFLGSDRRWRMVVVTDVGSGDEIQFKICNVCGCWTGRRYAGETCSCDVPGCHNKPQTATGQALAVFRPRKPAGSVARIVAPAKVTLRDGSGLHVGNDRLRTLAAEVARTRVPMRPGTHSKPEPRKLGEVKMSAVINGVKMVYDKAAGGWEPAPTNDAS